MGESTNDILKNYIPLVEFLGTVLGENSEVILHDVTDLDHSVVAVSNPLSGRKIGAPATDLVLDFVHKAKGNDTKFVSNYKGKTEDNRIFNSSSFFIRNEGVLIGILCVNTDESLLLDLQSRIDNILGCYHIKDNKVEETKEIPLESLYSNSNKLITEEIERISNEKGISPSFLKGMDKIEIVERLYNKGFFLLKDAIPQVARGINVSEPSVYRYLKLIKDKTK